MEIIANPLTGGMTHLIEQLGQLDFKGTKDVPSSITAFVMSIVLVFSSYYGHMD